MHRSPAGAKELPARELTARAVTTGMLIGAALTPCNVYSGLKVGWSFNMSITAALLGFAFWRGASRVTGAPRWEILESNISQTTASSSASIISAGLVAPIPALTLLTGQTLSLPVLAAWILAVSLIGVVLAVGLRRRLIVEEGLAFPAGVATAETIREIFARGAEAAVRVRVLLGAGGLAAAVKITETLSALPRPGLPFALAGGGALKPAGHAAVTMKNLGFVLDPSLLMVGFGAIIGMRAGASLLLGAVLAWAVLGPLALRAGWAQPGPADPTAPWFASAVQWLLWPGVTLMVSAALTSFALAAVGTLRGRAREPRGEGEKRRHWLFAGFAATGALAVLAQVLIFDIAVPAAVLAVLLTTALAVVAARVSGETGITPIGAMGKVTQLALGVAAPGSVTANLMGANVTGGAAGQCADLMHDLKTGFLVRADAARQAVAQCFGVLAGSLAGSVAYLLLVPDPAAMLLTAEWPAPAVATWKAVAEVLRDGLGALPPGSRGAMIVAALAGIGLAVVARVAPARWRVLVPSAPALGLAFVIPAWNSLSMFLGAAAALAFSRVAPRRSERFLLAVAAGFVAGESLAGVGVAASTMLGG